MKKYRFPKISVLMSVHNGDKYLKESIDSILSQTYTDFEFIIVDDMSTDKSAQIIDSYSDYRIRVFKNQKNLGLTKSLNKVLSMAKGEYIARIDADDISLPNRFEVQKKYLDSHPDISLIGSWAEIIDSNGNIIGTDMVPSDEIIIKYSFILGKPSFIHSSWFFRRKIMDELGGYDEKQTNAQDFELLSRLLKKFHATNIDKILVRLRIHSDSITSSLQNQTYEKIKGLDVIFKNINNYTTIEKDRFLVFYKSKTKGVDSLKEMLSSLYTLSSIQKSFIKKEMPKKDVKKIIVGTYRSIRKTIVIKYLNNFMRLRSK